MGRFSRAVSYPLAIRVAQIVIGAVFAFAAVSKLGDLRTFALQVHNFRLAPIWSENLVAMTLPWVELTAAFALILGVRARAAAWIVAALLAGFTLGVGVAMARGLDFECGCFGKADHTRVGSLKLAENLSMLAVALLAARRRDVQGKT
jgi:putative oxidoreductase